MKFLDLRFKDAKLFKTDKNTKDLIVDYSITRIKSGALRNSNTRSTLTDKNFKNPITALQVANVLRVIFGERPSPSKRTTIIPADKKFLDMARNSYLKYDTVKSYNKKKDEYEFITEFSQTNKLPGLTADSWMKGITPTWLQVKARCEVYSKKSNEDEFGWLIGRLTEIFDVDPLSMSFLDFIELRKKSKNTFFEKFGELQKRLPAMYYVFNYSYNEMTNIKGSVSLINLVNLKGIETKMTVLNGKILVPVSDEDLEKIRDYGQNHATILDGGLLYINGIIDANSITPSEVDGMFELNQISEELCELK